MTPENKSKSEQYLTRAIDFIHAARTLCETHGQGHLPSSCLLVGTAMELLAKKRLLEKGIEASKLKAKAYGHDLQNLWKQHTDLYAEAEQISDQIRQNGDQPDSFDFAVHFEALARGYGNESDYSLRYHNGERSFANACMLGRITERIAGRERMRRQDLVQQSQTTTTPPLTPSDPN